MKGSHDTCWVGVTSVILDLEQGEDLFQLQWPHTWVLEGTKDGGGGVLAGTELGDQPVTLLCLPR